MKTRHTSPRRPLRARGPASASTAAQTQVARIMSADVMTVRPEMLAESAAQAMLERDISGLPVVDDDGAPLGMLSKTDLIRAYQDAGIAVRDGAIGPEMLAVTSVGATVDEVMSAGLLTVPETASIQDAARIMASHGYHRLPVVAEDGRITGLVTTMDVMAWLAGMR